MKTYPLGFVLEEHAALVIELEATGTCPREDAATIAETELPALLAYADEWDTFVRDCIISVAARKILALRPMNRTPAP